MYGDSKDDCHEDHHQDAADGRPPSETMKVGDTHGKDKVCCPKGDDPVWQSHGICSIQVMRSLQSVEHIVSKLIDDILLSFCYLLVDLEISACPTCKHALHETCSCLCEPICLLTRTPIFCVLRLITHAIQLISVEETCKPDYLCMVLFKIQPAPCLLDKA